MRKFLKTISLFILGGMILLGANSCLKESPEKILKKMINKMAEVESYYVDLKFGLYNNFPLLADLTKQNAELKPGAISFDFKGDVNLQKELQCQLLGDISYRVLADTTAFAGDLVSVNNKIYFRLASTSALEPLNLSLIKAQWYKFDLASLGLEQSEKISRADQKKIQTFKKLIKQTDLIDVVSDNGIELLNDKRMHHYDVKINANGLEKFFNRSQQIFGNQKLSKKEKQRIEANIERWKQIKAQVWIGEDDYYLYRVEASWAGDGPDKLRYNLALGFSDFGKAVNIVEPTDVREVDLAKILVEPTDGQESTDSETIDINEKLGEIKGVNLEEVKKKLQEMEKEE